MPSATTVLLRTQTDERLVALARAGHERAFEAIVERYRRPLVRACRRVLPEGRAEDAVQQALMAAWAGLLRGDEVRQLRPWMYRIAHNTALNQLRVSGYDYDELHGLLDSGPAPEEELERREVARRTLTGLAALPERQREALLQVAVQGRGQDEVARALGISEPAVRQLVHRARTRLRTAATALTPMPLAGWLADAGSRADLVAGGGGVAATVAKVGAIVVLAGGAAAGPTVIDRFEHGGARTPAAAPLGAAVADAAETAARSRPAATPAAVATPSRHRSARHAALRPAPSGAGSRHVSREDRSRRAAVRGDDSPGSGDDSGGDGSRRGSSGGGGSGGETSGRDSSGGDGSRDGASGEGTSGDPSSGDGGTSGGGTSGSGSSGDDAVAGGATSGGDISRDSSSGGGSSGGSSDGGSSGGSSGGGTSGDGSPDPVAPMATATPSSGSGEPLDHASAD